MQVMWVGGNMEIETQEQIVRKHFLIGLTKLKDEGNKTVPTTISLMYLYLFKIMCRQPAYAPKCSFYIIGQNSA